MLKNLKYVIIKSPNKTRLLELDLIHRGSSLTEQLREAENILSAEKQTYL